MLQHLAAFKAIYHEYFNTFSGVYHITSILFSMAGTSSSDFSIESFGVDQEIQAMFDMEASNAIIAEVITLSSSKFSCKCLSPLELTYRSSYVQTAQRTLPEPVVMEEAPEISEVIISIIPWNLLHNFHKCCHMDRCTEVIR